MLDVSPARGCSLRLDDQDATNGILTLIIVGDIDEMSAPLLHAAVIDALRRYRPARIEMDLAEATFVDSAGIDTLLLCQADAEQVECRFVVNGADPVADS